MYFVLSQVSGELENMSVNLKTRNQKETDEIFTDLDMYLIMSSPAMA
jgi:hypothetical protein